MKKILLLICSFIFFISFDVVVDAATCDYNDLLEKNKIKKDDFDIIYELKDGKDGLPMVIGCKTSGVSTKTIAGKSETVAEEYRMTLYINKDNECVYDTISFSRPSTLKSFNFAAYPFDDFIERDVFPNVAVVPVSDSVYNVFGSVTGLKTLDLCPPYIFYSDRPQANDIGRGLYFSGLSRIEWGTEKFPPWPLHQKDKTVKTFAYDADLKQFTKVYSRPATEYWDESLRLNYDNACVDGYNANKNTKFNNNQGEWTFAKLLVQDSNMPHTESYSKGFNEDTYKSFIQDGLYNSRRHYLEFIAYDLRCGEYKDCNINQEKMKRYIDACYNIEKKDGNWGASRKECDMKSLSKDSTQNLQKSYMDRGFDHFEVIDKILNNPYTPEELECLIKLSNPEAEQDVFDEASAALEESSDKMVEENNKALAEFVVNIEKMNFGDRDDTCYDIFGKTFTSIIKACFTILRIVGAIIAIVNGMVALIPAIVAKDDDALKKAINKCIKMAVILVVIGIFPTILNLIGTLFDFDLSCLF